MINKIKKFIDYNLLITFLIILLLGMLYLGNYNLIEGNTQQETVNNGVALLDQAALQANVMSENSPVPIVEGIDCEELQNTLQINCSKDGGADTQECQTQFKSAQNQYAIAVKNGLCSDIN